MPYYLVLLCRSCLSPTDPFCKEYWSFHSAHLNLIGICHVFETNSSSSFSIYNFVSRAGEMASKLRTLTALPGNLGPISSDCMQFTTICDSIPLGSNDLIWPPKAPGKHMIHKYTWGQGINSNKYSNQKKLLYLFVSVLNPFEDPSWCLVKLLITYCFHKMLVGLFKLQKLNTTYRRKRKIQGRQHFENLGWKARQNNLHHHFQSKLQSSDSLML